MTLNTHTLTKPTISIIVAVYNGEKTLQHCIDSISEQTYPHHELIIIDGKSTDNTVKIIKSNQKQITYWESKPDNGIYHAWNKALSHITGEWILFLGADDYLWNNTVFENIVPHLSHAPPLSTPIVYGQVARVTKNNETGCIDGFSWKQTQKSIITDGICTFTHQGMFHHHTLFSLYGTFDESFAIVGDYEFLLRIFKNGTNALFINNLIIAGMQIGGATTNALTLVKEVYKARQKNHLPPITIPWIISLTWAILYPFFTHLLGDKNTRYLLNLGKRLVMYISNKP